MGQTAPGAPEGLGLTTVLHVVAGGDDLVELAPVVRALARRRWFRQIVLDASAEPALLQLRWLDVVHRRLALAAGTPAQRTAAALVAIDAVILEERPDLVVVGGDDDVVVAAAIAAAKRRIAVAHLGAGLRCWDWTRPDEINRTVIDLLSDTLFTFCDDAASNLLDEGVPDGRIHAVGNTRIDMVRRYESRARGAAAWEAYGATEREYTLVTLHQPDSIGAPERLERIAAALGELAGVAPVLLLQHPGTRAMLATRAARALLSTARVSSVEAAGYVEALSLLAGAGAIVTDAVSVQEQASALGVRCYTILGTTPSTATLTHGTNVLLGDDPSAIASVRPTAWARTPAAIPLWDGRAGERVADALAANYALTDACAGQR